MVSREQKKMQKKKAKEKNNRKKILAQREKLRSVGRAEREEYRRDKRITRLQREMEDFDRLSTEQLKELPDNVLNQLERNAKILKVLEDEYTKEVDRKKIINDSLENEGYFTLEDKINALSQVSIQAQEEIGLSGGADCNFQSVPRLIKQETADVEVVRAVD